MRIGLLTYHCVPNFGAQLQTLSTVEYLRKKGHEPIVLNWYPKDLETIYQWLPPEQRKAHDAFTTTCFQLSALCRTEEELLCEIDKLNLDGILVGSDALFKYIPVLRRWYVKKGKYKPRILRKRVPSVEKLRGNPFFGGFLSKMPKRIPASVYAVSAQNTSFEKMCIMERRQMKSYMGNFNWISVRDTRTQQMIESVTGVSDIKIYPDPVFSFNQNVKELISSKEDVLEKFDIEQEYVLLSFRTENCSENYIQDIVAEIKKRGLLPIFLTMPEGVRSVGMEKVVSVPLSPMDWYALIQYSSGYIGERMHPIIVALHNAVPCFSFDEYGVSDELTQKVIFPKSEKWTKERSKIYHIMHTSGFDSNWYAYASKEVFPDPEVIVNKLIAFDREQCQLFADKQWRDYQDGMQKLLASLSQ